MLLILVWANECLSMTSGEKTEIICNIGRELNKGSGYVRGGSWIDGCRSILLVFMQDKRKRELEKKEAKESRKKLKTKSGLDDDKDGFEEVPLSFSVSTPTFGEDEEEGPDCRPRTPEEIAEVGSWNIKLIIRY